MARQNSIESQIGQNESFQKNRISADELPPAIRAKILAQQKKDVDERLKSGEAPENIAWENFEEQAIKMHDNISAEKYLDEYLGWQKSKGSGFEELCYQLFTDFSTGRKKFQSQYFAEKMADTFLDSNNRDVNKLRDIAVFFEKNHNNNKAAKVYFTLYELYFHGDGTGKDIANAVKFLKSSINLKNTPEKRSALLEIYKQENESLPKEERTRKAYEKLIADKIEYAELDYANYLKAHDKKSDARYYFLAAKKFEDAYALVNIKNQTDIQTAINEFKKGAADTEFAYSLKLMNSNFSVMQDIFNFKEPPPTYWGLAWRYLFMLYVYPMYRSFELNKLIFFIALIASIGAGVIGNIYFGFVGAVGFFTFTLSIWAMAMLVVDIKIRQQFVSACEFLLNLQPHPQLEEKRAVFSGSEKIVKGSKNSGFLALPFFIYICFPLLLGVFLSDVANSQIQEENYPPPSNNYEENQSSSQNNTTETEKEETLEPKEPAEPEYSQGVMESADNLFAFYENITNKNYRQSYNLFSDDVKKILKFEDWDTAAFHNINRINIEDVMIVSETSNEITFQYKLLVVDNSDREYSFDQVANFVKTKNGWKISDFKNPNAEPEKPAEPPAPTNPAEPAEPAINSTPEYSQNVIESTNNLIAFHEYITNKNYRQAYNLFSDEWKNHVKFDGWSAGFKTTVSSSADNITLFSETSDTIVLNYTLTAVDNPGGTRYFDSSVTFVKTRDGWRINHMKNTKR